MYIFFPFFPPVSECQLCGWWSWVGNSVERWGGQVGELSIPLLLLPLGAWRFIFTYPTCTSWNTWAVAILWRSYVWRLLRNAVSELPVDHILKQENNLLCSIFFTNCMWWLVFWLYVLMRFVNAKYLWDNQMNMFLHFHSEMRLHEAYYVFL